MCNKIKILIFLVLLTVAFLLASFCWGDEDKKGIVEYNKKDFVSLEYINLQAKRIEILEDRLDKLGVKEWGETDLCIDGHNAQQAWLRKTETRLDKLEEGERRGWKPETIKLEEKDEESLDTGSYGLIPYPELRRGQCR